MTKEEFLQELENLDEEYFKRRWEHLIKKHGLKHAINTYVNPENYKKHILKHYKSNMASTVEADCEVIRLYHDYLIKLGKVEFINTFGEFKFAVLNNAISNQNNGFWAYAKKV